MRHAPFTLAVLMLAAVQGVFACPVCFGDKDSPMTAGMDSAILVMLGITGFMLTLIALFFVMVWRRLKRQNEQMSDHAFVDAHGKLQLPNDTGVFEWNNS